jgi:hypothetical protein
MLNFSFNVPQCLFSNIRYCGIGPFVSMVHADKDFPLCQYVWPPYYLRLNFGLKPVLLDMNLLPLLLLNFICLKYQFPSFSLCLCQWGGEFFADRKSFFFLNPLS